MERELSDVVFYRPPNNWSKIPEASVIRGQNNAFLRTPGACVQLDPGDRILIRYGFSSGKRATIQQDAYACGGSRREPTLTRLYNIKLDMASINF